MLTSTTMANIVVYVIFGHHMKNKRYSTKAWLRRNDGDPSVQHMREDIIL